MKEHAIDYIVTRIRKVDKTVDQASIDIQRGTKARARTKFVKARKEILIKDDIEYRYIGAINSERRLEALRDLFKEKESFTNFYVTLIPEPVGSIPAMSFTILDEKEVFVRAPYEDAGRPVYMSIKSEDIAKLFQAYFDFLLDKRETAQDRKAFEKLFGKFKP